MGFFSRKKKSEAKDAQAQPASTISSSAQEGSAPLSPEEEEIKNVLAQKLVAFSEGNLALEAIDPRARLLDEGYVDSLKSADLLVFIKQKYGVEITEMQLVGRLYSLEALAKHIHGQRG